MDLETKEKFYSLLNKANITDLVDKIVYMSTDKDDDDLNSLDSFITFQSLTLNTSNIPKYETIYQVSIFAKTSIKVSQIEKEVLKNLNKTRNEVRKKCKLTSEKEAYDTNTGLNVVHMTFRVVWFNTMY